MYGSVVERMLSMSRSFAARFAKLNGFADGT
jgi:hypothetical protein